MDATLIMIITDVSLVIYVRSGYHYYYSKLLRTCLFVQKQLNITALARHGGVEVAGWTLDLTTRVRFPAYHHRVWAL